MRGEAECECGGLIVIVSLGWWLHVGWAGGGCGSWLVSFVTDWHKAQGTRLGTTLCTTPLPISHPPPQPPGHGTSDWQELLFHLTLLRHTHIHMQYIIYNITNNIKIVCWLLLVQSFKVQSDIYLKCRTCACWHECEVSLVANQRSDEDIMRHDALLCRASNEGSRRFHKYGEGHLLV